MGFAFSENEIKFYNDNGELCCFECGSTEEIQMHHIVPKSRGGEKMISICYSCHQKAHHKKAKLPTPIAAVATFNEGKPCTKPTKLSHTPRPGTVTPTMCLS